jgi:hypothetical protein
MSWHLTFSVVGHGLLASQTSPSDSLPRWSRRLQISAKANSHFIAIARCVRRAPERAGCSSSAQLGCYTRKATGKRAPSVAFDRTHPSAFYRNLPSPQRRQSLMVPEFFAGRSGTDGSGLGCNHVQYLASAPNTHDSMPWLLIVAIELPKNCSYLTLAASSDFRMTSMRGLAGAGRASSVVFSSWRISISASGSTRRIATDRRSGGCRVLHPISTERMGAPGVCGS